MCIVREDAGVFEEYEGSIKIMRRIKRWVFLGGAFWASLGLILCCGCSPKQANTAADLVAENISPWVAGTDNPLMRYVPSDAPLILATQRGHDRGNAGMRNLAKIFGNEKLFFGALIGEDLSELLSNYDVRAPQWGLDPEGRVDAVLYMYDNRIVIHVTVADAASALTRLDTYMQKVSGYIKLRTVEADGWRVYVHDADGKSSVEASVGVHVQGEVMSIGIWWGDRELPNAILKPVSSPYRVDGGRDDVLIAHLNHAGIGEFLMRIPWVAAEMDEYYINEFISKNDREKMIAFCRSDPKYCLNREYKFSNSVTYEAYWAAREAAEAQGIEVNDQESWEEDPNAEGSGEFAPGEMIDKIGSTSIGEEVCIGEFKSAFADVPETDIAVTVSASGKLGGRLVMPIASADMYKEMNALITEHDILQDEDAMAYGFVGIKLYDGVINAMRRMEAFEKRGWKCAQMQGISEGVQEKRKDLERALQKKDEFATFITGFESLSFIVKDLIIGEYAEDETPIKFLLNMRNSSAANHLIADYFFETPVQDGVIMTVDAGDLKPNILVSDKTLWVGTEPYELAKVTSERKREGGAGLYISKQLIDKVIGNVRTLKQMEDSFLSDYRVDLGMKDSKVMFEVEPVEMH